MFISHFIFAYCVLIQCWQVSSDAVIQVGTTPNLVLFTQNGSFAFVSNYGTVGTSKGGSINVIDTKSLAVIRNVTSNLLSHPVSLGLSNDEATLYVANSLGLSFYDVVHNTVDNLNIMSSFVRNLHMSKDKKKIFISHNLSQGFLSVISSEQKKVVGKIELASGYPVSITSWFNNTEKLYVAHQLGNISIVDVESLKMIGNIETPTNLFLHSIAFEANTERLFVSTGTVLHNKGGILIYDANSNKLLKRLSGIGSSPNSLAISKDGHNAYIASPLTNMILVLDTSHYQVKDQLQITCKSTIGRFALSPNETQLYITCMDQTVIVRDLHS